MTKFIKADDVNNLYEVTWDATKALLSKSKLEAFTWGLKMAIEEIQKLPTVETTPVRKGKWIECEGRKNEYYCSECYDIWKSDRIKNMKYCPSCRAKMEFKLMEMVNGAEPKHGHWNKINPIGIYECSECGQPIMTGDIECYNYCHHCGAKMDANRQRGKKNEQGGCDCDS